MKFERSRLLVLFACAGMLWGAPLAADSQTGSGKDDQKRKVTDGKDREKTSPRQRRRGSDREPDPEVVAAAKAVRGLRNAKDLPSSPGKPAPDFHLKLLEKSKRPDYVLFDKDERVRLSAYKGKQPVVLIFGSYT